jgi:hypothetical protein
MKSVGKSFLPELQVNPINRDLVIVLFSALLLAMGVGTALALLVMQL